MQALTVELLNERKYSAILDDLNRFREVCKLVTPWGPPGHLDSSHAHVCFHASKSSIVKEEHSSHLRPPASTRSNMQSVLTRQDVVCRRARLWA